MISNCRATEFSLRTFFSRVVSNEQELWRSLIEEMTSTKHAGSELGDEGPLPGSEPFPFEHKDDQALEQAKLSQKPLSATNQVSFGDQEEKRGSSGVSPFRVVCLDFDELLSMEELH